jgi:hypothetical protein
MISDIIKFFNKLLLKNGGIIMIEKTHQRYSIGQIVQIA